MFAGLGPKLTAASSPILTHIWPPKLQYLSVSQFVKYLFPQLVEKRNPHCLAKKRSKEKLHHLPASPKENVTR